MLAHNCRDRVIGNPGDANRVLALETIRPRGRYCQHVNIDAVLIHMLQAFLDVLSLQRRRVDAAFEFFVIEVTHAAMGIGLFENDCVIPLLHLGEILGGKNMGLKIDDHAGRRTNRSYTSYRSYSPYSALALASRILLTTGVGTTPSSLSLRNAKISDDVSLWP